MLDLSEITYAPVMKRNRILRLWTVTLAQKTSRQQRWKSYIIIFAWDQSSRLSVSGFRICRGRPIGTKVCYYLFGQTDVWVTCTGRFGPILESQQIMRQNRTRRNWRIMLIPINTFAILNPRKQFTKQNYEAHAGRFKDGAQMKTIRLLITSRPSEGSLRLLLNHLTKVMSPFMVGKW